MVAPLLMLVALAMLDFTVTALGRELLRTWLMRPSCSSSVIQERHDAITCFLLPENMTASDYLHSQLKGTRNIPRVLARLKAGKAKSNEWQALVKVGR
jgi:DNA mismatch repair protein MSH5